MKEGEERSEDENGEWTTEKKKGGHRREGEDEKRGRERV